MSTPFQRNDDLWNAQKFHAQGVAEGRARAASKIQDLENAVAGCLRQCPDATRADIFHATTILRRERLDAVPDLKKFPELAGCREALLAYDAGLQQGGGLSASEVALLREAWWFCQLASRSGSTLPPRFHAPQKGCTATYLAHSPVGPLAGNNWDVIFNSEPLYAPGRAWQKGGIGCIGVSCGILMDEDAAEIFPVPMDHLAQQVSPDLDSALELYTRYNHFWGPRNLLVFDAAGRSAVIEKSARRFGIRRGGEYSFTTAMHMETSEMKPFLRARRNEYLQQKGMDETSYDQTYWAGAEMRHHNLGRLMQDAAENPSWDALRAVMQNHDEFPAKICLHGEPPHPDAQVCESTVATTIYEIQNDAATFWSMTQSDVPACQTTPRRIEF